LLLAGSVLNTSLVTANDEVPATESTTQAPAQDVSVGTKITGKFNDVANFLVAKKDVAVAQVKAHPYIASTAAVSTVLVAAYKFSATFRRLIGMETQEDMQKRYSASFEV
jgi:hypothetical protein